MKIEADLRLRHPNHFVLEGTNNRNVIITYRFLVAPVQGNRDFFWHTDCICEESVSTFLNIHVSNWSASLGFHLLGEIPEGATISHSFVHFSRAIGIISYLSRPHETAFFGQLLLNSAIIVDTGD